MLSCCCNEIDDWWFFRNVLKWFLKKKYKTCKFMCNFKNEFMWLLITVLHYNKFTTLIQMFKLNQDAIQTLTS